MGDLLLYLKQMKLKCWCSWQFQYQLNTHYENNFNTTGQQKFSFTWLSRSTWWNETDIYTSFSSHTLQKIGMKLTGWKKDLTDCGNTKTTENSIQHTFKRLQHFQRSGNRKVCFSLQRKGSFQTMYCQEMQMFRHENIQTVQLHWLYLQHQSVLEVGQTMSSPTVDSSTCHSDITSCGSKSMSSQTEYGELILFPSPIWWLDNEKDLLLRKCH